MNSAEARAYVRELDREIHYAQSQVEHWATVRDEVEEIKRQFLAECRLSPMEYL